MSAVFLLTFWLRAIFPVDRIAISFPFTSQLISCTITTLSVGCQQDWDFNFVPSSPDTVRSWNKSSAAGKKGLLCCSPLTACFSNYFWKGERYSSSGIHCCQPPVDRCSCNALHERWSIGSPEASVVPPLHHLYYLLSEASKMSHWKLVCWAEKKRGSRGENAEIEKCALQSHLFGLSWNFVSV